MADLQREHLFLNAAKERVWSVVFKMLQESPSLINVQPSDRWSALHQAANEGQEVVCADLLALRADPNALTTSGETPLQVAIGGGAKKVLEAATKMEVATAPAWKSVPSHGDGGAPAPSVIPNWGVLADEAQKMWCIYERGYAFPEWSIMALRSESLTELAKEVTLYYKKGDNVDDVKDVARQREPVNIAMGRYFDQAKLEADFEYKWGAYARSTKDKLMPNIAIYCQTPIRARDGYEKQVHCINVIGYAFDSPKQPDWQYFLPCKEGEKKWEELVECFKQMWRYIFQCAHDKGLKRIYLADVGGGAFSDGINSLGPGYHKLKAESLELVEAEFEEKRKAAGLESFVVDQLPRIPDFAFTADAQIIKESLLVNAWDPWSMVGNGNNGDNSLDGFWGRCTAMAVLCWPLTNPYVLQDMVAV